MSSLHRLEGLVGLLPLDPLDAAEALVTNSTPRPSTQLNVLHKLSDYSAFTRTGPIGWTGTHLARPEGPSFPPPRWTDAAHPDPSPDFEAAAREATWRAHTLDFAAHTP